MNEQLSALFKNLPTEIQKHCVHTSVYVRILGENTDKLKKLYPNMSDEELLSALMSGGLYHDFGKLGLSTYILNKKSSLSDTEWEIMRQHPTYAEEILKKGLPADGYSGCAIEIIIHMAKFHHERIDGEGYPFRLSGDEIPFAAQLCSVADTFDAMTSNRRYRSARNAATAYETICKNAGTQFGIDAIECFKQAYPEMCILYKKNKR